MSRAPSGRAAKAWLVGAEQGQGGEEGTIFGHSQRQESTPTLDSYLTEESERAGTRERVDKTCRLDRGNQGAQSLFRRAIDDGIGAVDQRGDGCHRGRGEEMLGEHHAAIVVVLPIVNEQWVTIFLCQHAVVI